MPFTALLDACVLYPIGICSLLLDVAEAGLYRVLWSEQILDEARRNILQDLPDLSAADLDRRFDCMRRAFPDATVTGYDDLIPAMTNHPGDRHVLAAAVRGRADVIVTENLRHFPDGALDPYGIEAQSADEFLSHAFDLDPEAIVVALDRQAQARQRPPNTVGDILAALTPVLPEFTEAVGAFLARTSPREPWLRGLKLTGIVLGAPPPTAPGGANPTQAGESPRSSR